MLLLEYVCMKEQEEEVKEFLVLYFSEFVTRYRKRYTAWLLLHRQQQQSPSDRSTKNLNKACGAAAQIRLASPPH